jgi:hypothetical protein
MSRLARSPGLRRCDATTPEGGTPHHGRVPRWFIAPAFFIVAAAVAWFAVTQGEISATLSDGRQVLLASTTYGTNHWFYAGNSLVKAIRGYIKPARALQLGLRSYLHLSAETNLVFWTYWRFPGTNRASLFASVCDRHGIESDPAPPAVFAPVPQRPEALVAWQFKNFPRREKTFLLHFYERDQQYRPHWIGELKVRNPVHVRFREWSASAPPVTVKQGELKFSLVELRSAEPVPERLRTQASSVARWTIAVFEVRHLDMEDSSWKVRRFEALGATGNSFTLFAPKVQQRDGELLVGFSNVLWPDEPIWKFKVEFSSEANFVPDETWTAHTVPLGRGAPTVLSNLNVSLQGTTLTDLELRVLSQSELSPSLPPPRNTSLKLQFNPAIPGLRIDLVRAVDDRGRELSRDDGLEFPLGTCATRFQTFADSQSVDLTFAGRKSRLIEFLVRPVFVGSNAPSPFPETTKANTKLTK